MVDPISAAALLDQNLQKRGGTLCSSHANYLHSLDASNEAAPSTIQAGRNSRHIKILSTEVFKYRIVLS